MRALILGSNGQLGQALLGTAPDGMEYVGLDLPELDIVNADRLLGSCREAKPDIIINAAAYTAVDLAETEIELATAVNVDGARNVAGAARDVGARLIHISTDFVFDGQASTPYRTDAVTKPLSIYGRTKRDGELAVLETLPEDAVVVRTAWLYSKTGNNFVKTMLRLMADRDELSVVSDQFGTPTWADSLATALWAFADRPGVAGIFHWTDGGTANWHDFAKAIQEEALTLGFLDRTIPIHAISSDEYPTAAKRPRYSVLDCSTTCAALDLRRPEWRVNLRKMLKGMAT
jgi:dTDP-4-dehydrorhamnose reductase